MGLLQKRCSVRALEATECGGKGDTQAETIQLVGSSWRVDLTSRSVNRVEIAGRVLSFLLMKIKHLWTSGLGKMTLVNTPELAKMERTQSPKMLRSFSSCAGGGTWPRRGGEREVCGTGCAALLLLCAKTARPGIVLQVDCAEI